MIRAASSPSRPIYFQDQESVNGELTLILNELNELNELNRPSSRLVGDDTGP